MVIFSDSICGIDTDEVFAYSTKKVVWIRDRWVGLLYYFMAALVLLWVVGDQVMWQNDHFLLRDVQGMPRLWFSHPTLNGCDPGEWDCKSSVRRLVDLPYCDMYRGTEKYDQRAHCEYRDRVSLQDTGSRLQSVFIPTAVELVTEQRNCKPGPDNAYSCDNVYETLPGSDCLQDSYLCKTRGNRTKQFFYVADINNFVVRFTSSYERGDIRGTSLMHQGYVGVCHKLLRLANTTQTWSDRKANAKYKCATGEFDMQRLPCRAGADCKKVRSFDRLEDTGVSVAGRHLQEVLSSNLGDNIGLRGAVGSFSWEAEAALGEDGVRAQGRPHGKGAGPAGGGRPRLRPGAGGDGRASLAALREEPARAAPDTPRGVPDMYTDNWGDVFKVRLLLELAGANLDRSYNMDGWTARQAGTALEVQIVYNNLHPLISSFGYKPVSYHYSVRQLTLPYVSRVKLAAVQPDAYPETRSYEVQYGLLIYFKVSGSFGFFNLIYLIVMLTAAFALTSTATTITDFVSLYLHPRRKNFFHLKYEVSPDFSDTWTCPECGFHNKSADDHCQGHERWSCPVDTTPCGAARPRS